MVRIISNNVVQGTKIITDKWRAYLTASRELGSYEHETINHKLIFVDPLSLDTHTQNIEGLWSRSKYF
jgi:transposase-like protein